jgi:hypothetical protein
MINDERQTAERIREHAQRQIWVTFQKEGIHCYPAAGEDPKLADVNFLSYPHRHIFHFRVSIDVWHNDRDIEFVQFKRWLESLYSGQQNCLSLDNKSCEMIADDLYIQIAGKYPGRNVSISVSEDNENGCHIQYSTHRPSLLVKV